MRRELCRITVIYYRRKNVEIKKKKTIVEPFLGKSQKCPFEAHLPHYPVYTMFPNILCERLCCNKDQTLDFQHPFLRYIDYRTTDK